MSTDLDLPSFKMGQRLKRLQQAAKMLLVRTKKLYIVKNLSLEESGNSIVMSAETGLKNPGTHSKEHLRAIMDQAEEQLLDAALTVIECLESERDNCK